MCFAWCLQWLGAEECHVHCMMLCVVRDCIQAYWMCMQRLQEWWSAACVSGQLFWSVHDLSPSMESERRNATVHSVWWCCVDCDYHERHLSVVLSMMSDSFVAVREFVLSCHSNDRSCGR